MISSKVKILLLGFGLACTVSIFGQTQTFKLATLSPDGSAPMKDFRETLASIESKTEGRVSFRLYAGGVMGDDTAVLRKMRVRQLQGGILQTSAFEQFDSSIGLYNLPMIFQDLEEVTAVRTELDASVIDSLEQRNLTVLGFVGLGFANAMGKHPATSMAHARGLKVWSPKGDEGARRLLQGFGITPTPLSPIDVLTGLQTGLIDTVAGPPIQIIALQWHTQVKYLLNLPFMYIYSVFVVNSQSFNKLEAGDQEIFRSSIKAMLSRTEQLNYSDHQRAIEALHSQGIETLNPSATELEEWRVAAYKSAEDWVNRGHLDKRLVDSLHSMLESYRAQRAQ